MKPTPAISAGKKRAGSSLLMALLTLAVLSIVGTTVLMNLSSRYGNTRQAVGWQGALAVAEAGADFGLANCRWTINGNSTPWAGWKKSSGVNTWTTVTSTADATAELAAGRRIIYDPPPSAYLSGSGQGATNGWYHVEVDAPAAMVISGNRWYRIRSTGYQGLAQVVARAGEDNPDGTQALSKLRKVDLKIDHFIAKYGDYSHATPTAVSVAPQATRRVEVVAQPKTSFGFTIYTTATSGAPLVNPVIDSYDSTDTLNYPGGIYNSLARDRSKKIGTNASVYINAPISSLPTDIYGDVTTAGGTLTNGTNISGTVRNDGTLPVPTVSVPTWGTVATLAAPPIIVAGTTSAPLYATYTKANKITVTLPLGQTTGVANLYVTGDVTGGITVAKGVTLKIWTSGDFRMKAADIDNLNLNPINLQIYGIDPPPNTSRQIDLGSGNPGFRYIVFNCPGYDFFNNGNPDFCGAIIAKTISGNGNTSWHYDEALALAGEPTDYKRAIWVEDER